MRSSQGIPEFFQKPQAPDAIGPRLCRKCLEPLNEGNHPTLFLIENHFDPHRPTSPSYYHI